MARSGSNGKDGDRGAPRIVRAVAGSLLSAALLLYVARGLWIHASEIRTHPWQVRPAALLVSFVLLLAGYVVYFLLWKRILRDLGATVSAAGAYRAWAFSQLGKYVPGKVWSALGRVVLLRRIGVGLVPASLSTVYELILLVLSGLVVSAASLPLWDRRALRAATEHFLPAGSLLALGAAGLLALALPWTWNAAGRLAGRLVGRAVHVRPLRPGRIVPLAAGYAVSWLLAGAGFAALLDSFHPMPPGDLPGAGAAFIFAWVAGSLILMAPGGLGVRESVLLVYLGFLVPREVALVTVVAARIWTTSAELLLVAAAWAVRPPARG